MPGLLNFGEYALTRRPSLNHSEPELWYRAAVVHRSALLLRRAARRAMDERRSFSVLFDLIDIVRQVGQLAFGELFERLRARVEQQLSSDFGARCIAFFLNMRLK